MEKATLGGHLFQVVEYEAGGAPFRQQLIPVGCRATRVVGPHPVYVPVQLAHVEAGAVAGVWNPQRSGQ